MRVASITLAGTLASLLLAACPTIKDVQCLDDTSCDVESGGTCVTTSSGNRWCAYPDGACAGGMRYSDFDVGDGLAGACVPELLRLTVEKVGFGAGSVSGLVASSTIIDCGVTADCDADLAAGTMVTLTATPADGDIFYGWSGGGCTGTGDCVTTVQAATTITATFDQCDRSSADGCNAAGTSYESCSADGQVTATVACPMYCSETAKKCVDLDPSDDPVGHPLDALMDTLAGTGQDLSFPASCTAATCRINLGDGTIVGATSGSAAPSTVVAGHGRVFRVESLSVQGVVKVTGGVPLVILSNDAIVIRGVLDASADLRVGGPGSQPDNTACTGRFHRSANTASAGGGGGGRYTAGGAGGNSSAGAAGGAGGMVQSEPTLIPLLGGCRGGWVDEQGGIRVTWLGGGGGAVQLVSRKSVSLLGGGVIDVSGGGGESGDESYPTEPLGGTGGGSGGSVLIEAPSVTLDGSSVVISAKGGGGSASGIRGFNGSDGGYSAGPALGGMNPSGASGGNGGTETTPPTAGQNAAGTLGTDGGGGGGAVGLCRINTRSGDVSQQNGAAVRCIRPINTKLAERILP